MDIISTRDAARKEAARFDSQRLQGKWSYHSGPRVADLVIDGDGYEVRFRSGDVYRGTFDLDPMHRPRAMDMTIEDGPDRHAGKFVRAIYALDGDHLIWSPSVPDGDDRPRAFPGPQDRGALWVIFRRAE